MAMSRNSSRINFREVNQRRGPVLRLVHLVLAVVLAWAIGLLAFIAAIPQPDRTAEADRPTDAIIVLTGGGDRLAEGFRLLDRGLARRLLISGVAQGVTLEQLIDRLGDQRDSVPAASELACCVTLGYAAESTVGNAEESADWLRSNGAKSVRLVTANYHMLRSQLEFRRALPDITVIANPVFPPEVRDPTWFLKPHTLLLLMNEYHKYLIAFARDLPGAAHRWSAQLSTPDWSTLVARLKSSLWPS
ncbi:MAG TPA: YdcF family protein [Dongiaceae bacterium]|jgi:uncharacterized SAM-binding protein YcdF (DUF218 family)|nr:YdcF family protein [Dongiaceae bacterium]